MSTRKQRPRANLTYKNCAAKFAYVMPPHIRTNDLVGRQLVTSITSPIEGCDWRGALSLYFHGDPYSPLLHNGPDFYFMLPATGNSTRTCRQTVFLAMFHHLHNKLMLIDPTGTPPFQTPIQEKYAFLQSLLNVDGADEEFAYMSLLELETLLQTIQTAVHYKTFASWAEYRDLFNEPWVPDATPDYERMEQLDKYIYNSEDLLDFLEAPIDKFIQFSIDCISPNSQVELLCGLVLKKIDCYDIFFKTGVKPKEINWIQELDLILKGTKN